MEMICTMIQQELKALKGADIVNSRSHHFMNISAHSMAAVHNEGNVTTTRISESSSNAIIIQA